jgi:hypothetical protein
MSTHVTSADPGSLTTPGSGYVYADPDTINGTDDNLPPTSFMPSTFSGVDPDEAMLPAEQGVQGIVGPVTGAQHMPNAAQPGSTSI